MISIIVPVYKAERYLRKCVESLLAQTFTDLEIILVDDGSPDTCPLICDEYAQKDKRIRVIHQNNLGQSMARNNALSIAVGEYIGFVDSDDWVEKEYCQTLYDLIQGKDLAICSYNTVYEGKPLSKRKHELQSTISLNKNKLWYEVFGNLNNAAWNKLYRRELLKGINFDTEMYHGEDLLFNLNYISKCEIASITNAHLYNYLKREGSVTTGLYTPKKKYEMVSKDKARDIVSEHYPSLLPVANRYCFRARLNVLRSIFKCNQERIQVEVVDECCNYLRTHFCKYKKYLTFKDIIEYFLFSYCRFLYKKTINKI